MYSYASFGTKKTTNKVTRPKPQQHPWMKKRMAQRAERQSRRSLGLTNQKNNILKSTVMTKINQMVRIVWNDLSKNLGDSGLIRLIGAGVEKFLPYAQLPDVPIELKALIVIAQSEEFEDAGALKKTIENVNIAKNDKAVKTVLTKYFDNKISDIIEQKMHKNILNPMRVVEQTRKYIEVIKDINQGEKEIQKNGNNKTGFQYQNTKNKLQDAKNRMERLINAFDFRGVQGLNLPKDFKKTETQIKISKENNAKSDKSYFFEQPFNGDNYYNNNNLNEKDMDDVYPEIPEPDELVDEPSGESTNNYKMKFDYGNPLPGNPLQSPATYGKLPDGRRYHEVTLKLDPKYPPKTKIDFNKNINKVNDGNLSKWFKIIQDNDNFAIIEVSTGFPTKTNQEYKIHIILNKKNDKISLELPWEGKTTEQESITIIELNGKCTIGTIKIQHDIFNALLNFSTNPNSSGFKQNVAHAARIKKDGLMRLVYALTNEQQQGNAGVIDDKEVTFNNKQQDMDINPYYNNNNISFSYKSQEDDSYFKNINNNNKNIKNFNSDTNINNMNDDGLSKLFEIAIDDNYINITIKNVVNMYTDEKYDIVMSCGKKNNVIYCGKKGLPLIRLDIELTKNNGQWIIDDSCIIPEKIGEALLKFSDKPDVEDEPFKVNIKRDGLMRLADKLTNEQKMSKNKISPKSQSRQSKFNAENYDLDEENIDNSKMLKGHLNTKNRTNYWDNVNK